MKAVTAFFNRIAETGLLPEEWDKSIATLLLKVVPPACPKDLRPIALASHTSKAFARLVLGRFQAVLDVKGYKQFAVGGRQPAEFVWSVMHILQRNGKVIAISSNSTFGKPLTRSTAIDSHRRSLSGRKVHVRSRSGVIHHEDQGAVLQGLPADGGCFMDDVLTWKSSLKSMQAFVDVLVPRLAFYGLQVQPAKCSLLCINGDRKAPLMVDGKRLLPMEKNEVLYVMNLPLKQEATEATIMEHLIDRARKKFFGIVHILSSKAPLRARMKLLNTVVFGVLRWVVGALFPTPQLQSMLNFFQVNCVRRMMRLARGKEEWWIDYEARTLRLARAMVHKMDGKRWGDVRTEAYWDFLGHRTRNGARENPSPAGLLSHFRGIQWWQEQQNISSGARHRRHYPHLMNCERRVAKTVGSMAWRDMTLDRHAWQTLRSKWSADVQIAWASGRQAALQACE